MLTQYPCQGKGDTYFIPDYALPDHMEPTLERRRQWAEMVKAKKRARHFYQKHVKEVNSIILPRESIDLSAEPYSDEVCSARFENCKLRQSKRNSDEEKRGDIVPEIKIDNINPKLQRIPPSQWTFEAAAERRKSPEELADTFGNLLSPCDTRPPIAVVAAAAFVPMAPVRSKSAPIKKMEKPKEEKPHRFLKFLRRKSL